MNRRAVAIIPVNSNSSFGCIFIDSRCENKESWGEEEEKNLTKLGRVFGQGKLSYENVIARLASPSRSRFDEGRSGLEAC